MRARVFLSRVEITEIRICPETFVRHCSSFTIVFFLLGWEDGKRCILMDKEKAFSHIKHGRLFLTQR